MTLPIIRPRRPLNEWNRCLQQGVVTIGFLGGSITDARPRYNWPEYVKEWLISSYPSVRFRIENAAIGATGSDLAVLRAQRDIIERHCDIVFIEYAVNDKDVPSARRRRTQEGLVRQLYKAGIKDLIFVYTFSSDMKEDIEQGCYPASIAELEELASYYHIPSIWVGKHGLEQVAAEKLTMEQWLPDGLHPQEQGSRIYADCVISYLRSALLHSENSINMQTDVPSLPTALDPQCWEDVTEVPLSEIQTKGQWAEERWHDYEWIDIMLETAQLDASLRFSFYGRGLMLVFDYGYRSAEFVYRMDDGEWKQSNRDCPEWVGAEGWLRLFDCGDEWEAAQHTFELQVIKPQHANSTASEFIFRLGKVGVIL